MATCRLLIAGSRVLSSGFMFILDVIYDRRYLMIWSRRRAPGSRGCCCCITAKETSNAVEVEKRCSNNLWRDFLAQQPSKAEDAPTAQKTFLFVFLSAHSVSALCRQSLKGSYTKAGSKNTTFQISKPISELKEFS